MKLSVENVAFSYENKKILSNLNLDVKTGEFVSIIGPSGCGKSTFLNILAGLIEKEEGMIYVDGNVVNGLSSHFAYMPQEDLLLPWMNIIDNVTLYGKVHHQEKKAYQKALESFELFGLKGYEKAYPKELSGGMRQRAAFLRTALCEADILLLDEPFGALDVITRNDMQDWLSLMRTTLNKTTLLVTHDIDEAIYLSDRILILGGKPAAVKRIIDLSEVKKSREWLYDQSALRNEIYHLLKEENNAL